MFHEHSLSSLINLPRKQSCISSFNISSPTRTNKSCKRFKSKSTVTFFDSSTSAVKVFRHKIIFSKCTFSILGRISSFRIDMGKLCSLSTQFCTMTSLGLEIISETKSSSKLKHSDKLDIFIKTSKDVFNVVIVCGSKIG